MAVRDVPPKIRPVYTCWPVFAWRYCCKTKKQFRREKGYYIKKYGPIISGYPTLYYVRAAEFSSKAEVAAFFDDFLKPPRPPHIGSGGQRGAP